MIPASCALDETGLGRQLERYRAAGAGARVMHRDRRKITIRVGDGAESTVIEELIAVERECCPFYTLEWDRLQRSLTVAVSTPDHEQALDAVAYALGVDQPA
jgi:hypothetical protein